MHVEIMVPEMVIENEIAQGCNQTDIAETYALAIAKVDAHKTVDWPRIHKAIRERWSDAAVERIKRKAWKIVEKRTKEAQQRATAHERN